MGKEDLEINTNFINSFLRLIHRFNTEISMIIIIVLIIFVAQSNYDNGIKKVCNDRGLFYKEKSCYSCTELGGTKEGEQCHLNPYGLKDSSLVINNAAILQS